MISRQTIRIYRVLSKTEYRTANDLAKELGVSSKTVRNQIKSLNKLLHDHGGRVEAKHAVGYRLTVHNAAKLKELEKLMQNYAYQRSAIPNSSRERIQYLLEYLLNTDRYVKLDDLSDQLYISTRTLSENLKKVERMLDEYDLRLQRKPGYGIRIEGAEFDRRLCIAQYTARRIEMLEGTGGQPEITDEVRWIYQCVRKCLSDHGFDMSGLALMNLVTHIQIAILRMQKGHFIPETEYGKENSGRTDKIAEEILRKVSKEFHVKYRISEAEYIAAHLRGKEMLGGADIAGGEGTLVIRQEISDLADQMLLSVRDAYQFDFRGDPELKKLLCQHLAPLLVRLRHNMRLYNPLIQEIKAQYLLAYAMAAAACAVLAQKFHTVIKEDEIGYIALIFELALEQEKTAVSRKNIMLVGASGKSSAQLLLHKYKNEFGPYIYQIHVCDIGHIDECDFSDIDYVFTTVPISAAIPVPIQMVGSLPTKPDIQAVKSILRGNHSMILDIYQEKLFFSHRRFSSREEALQALCGFMRELELTPRGFTDPAELMEHYAATSLGRMTAVVTPIRPAAGRPFASVTVLDRPVIWEAKGGPEDLVQVIVILSAANRELFNIRKFYSITSRLFGDSASVQELIRNQSYDTLRDLLVELERQIEQED